MNYKLVFVLAFTLFLVSCGGSDSKDKTVIEEPPVSEIDNAFNFIELGGAITGADVKIYGLDSDEILFSAVTNNIGRFELNRDLLQENVKNKLSITPELLLIIAENGFDTDADSNGDSDSSATQVKGKIKAIIPYKDLIDKENIHINLLTSVIVKFLEKKKNITLEDINSIVKIMSISDTNDDQIIDIVDTYFLSTSEYDSIIELDLRTKFQPYIYSGDELAQETYIEITRFDFGYSLYKEKKVDNEAVEIELIALDTENKVNYSINTSTLDREYVGESILLSTQDTLFYNECNQDDDCYRKQTVSYDGENTSTYIPIPSLDPYYTDFDKIKNLRVKLDEAKIEFIKWPQTKTELENDVSEHESVAAVIGEEIKVLEEELAGITP